MAEKPKIVWEIQENIGFVLLADEPENKMDTRFFRELHELTVKTIPAAKVAAVIITGKGRHFSSGADLEEGKGAIFLPALIWKVYGRLFGMNRRSTIF